MPSLTPAYVYIKKLPFPVAASIPIKYIPSSSFNIDNSCVPAPTIALPPTSSNVPSVSFNLYTYKSKSAVSSITIAAVNLVAFATLNAYQRCSNSVATVS